MGALRAPPSSLAMADKDAPQNGEETLHFSILHNRSGALLRVCAVRIRYYGMYPYLWPT